MDKHLPLPPFHMPAEWEPHEATLLAWPWQKSDWPGKFAPLPWVYSEIIRNLVASEPVLLIVPPASEKRVKIFLKKTGVDLGRVTFIAAATDRSWVRDSGPTGVFDQHGEPLLLEWQFDGWAKYDDWADDAQLAKVLEAHLSRPRIEPVRDDVRIVLEGGSIDVNGAGGLITTEECLLSEVQCRNPGFGKLEYEETFSICLGVDQTIWLNRGIAGDDTHGHVDDIARFVNERTVVAAVEADTEDDNYQPLQENLERLRGHKMDVVELPMPRPVYFKQRLPASYANFYIANSVVLVPTFNDPADRVALNTIAELFPNHKVIGIHSVDLVLGLGTLHCLSQQIPARRS